MAKLKLIAMGDYPDIEIECREVDIVGAEDPRAVVNSVTDGKVVTAKKEAMVTAREPKLGETVETCPRVVYEGKQYYFVETVQTIKQKHLDSNSKVVTNPDGEVYVVGGSKFEGDKATYKKVEEGVYSPIDKPKKFVTVTENICFKAPWGEMIFAPKGSKLCVEYIDSKDVYSVTNAAFDATYKEEGAIEDEDEMGI